MSPPLLLSLLVAAMIGLAAHALVGRHVWQLPAYLFAAAVGVFAGEVIAALTGVEPLRYGSVSVGAAVFGGLCAVAILWAVITRVTARLEARTRQH